MQSPQSHRNPTTHAVASEYFIHTGLNKEENRREEERKEREENAKRIPSEYLSTALRNADAKLVPAPLQQRKAIGYSISGKDLKSKLSTLDDIVYQPMIINGTLFFVATDSNVRTARSSSHTDVPTSDVDTAVEVPSMDSVVAPSVSSGISTALTILSSTLDNETFDKIIKAFLNGVATGRVRLSSQEAIDITRIMSGTNPSDSTITAAEFSSSTYLNEIGKRERKNNSAVTARSRSMQTGAEASYPTRTARTNSYLTAAELSAPANTARTNSYHTGAEASDPARTARTNSYLTGAEASDPARTARSCSLYTGAQRSSSCFTARTSESLVNDIDAREPCRSSAGAEPSSPCKTAKSPSDPKLQTATEKTSQTCNTPQIEAQDYDSMPGVAAGKLTRTPSDIDSRAAAAVPSFFTDNEKK